MASKYKTIAFKKMDFFSSIECKRLPHFELSYEIISHKKVAENYDMALAIPYGKKKIVWFSFKLDADVCFTFDLNKDRQLCNCIELPAQFDHKLALGTLLYGTMADDIVTGKQHFVVEDIFHFKGISTKQMKPIEKLVFIEQTLKMTHDTMGFRLPYMWAGELPANLETIVSYKITHIQYRCSREINPYVNVTIHRKKDFQAISSAPSPIVQDATLKPAANFRMDFAKTQYNYKTVFQVKADLQFDIYHLYAYGKGSAPSYYNLAYVPNYRSSVYLNGLFRKIRENKNIDYIEESDDEDDFQNTNVDKYVELQKVLLMECVFSRKFKKWVPIKVVGNQSKVVHISSLGNLR